MLIESVTESGPDLTGATPAARPLSASRLTGTAAANTATFARDEAQARRLRRQLRLERALPYKIGGWTARMW